MALNDSDEKQCYIQDAGKEGYCSSALSVNSSAHRVHAKNASTLIR
jgi:hypothetical protein